MKLLVAIPALNEELSISSVIDGVQTHIPEATVLVIDDGSKDLTATIAKSAGATVLKLPFNVGVGGALRTAFRYATENNFTHVMQIDADGQHLPSEARQLLGKIGQNDIVIGSRFNNNATNYHVGLPRKFAMQVLAKITSTICRTKLTDVTSGFRICSGSAVTLFSREYPRDYLGDTVESLIIAHKHGIPISEVPVTMKSREHGNPSQNTIKSIWYLTRALLVISLATLKKEN